MTSIERAAALQRPSVVALLVSLALALLGAGFLADQAKEILQRQRLHQALSASVQVLQELQESLLDMETGQRGFLLTGNASYLESFDDGHVKLKPLIGKLERQLGDTGEEDRANIRRLLGLVGQKERELRKTIALQHASKTADAIQVVESGLGKLAMDEVRRLVSELSAEHRIRQAWLEAENAALMERAEKAIGLWILAVIGLASASFWLVLQGQAALREAARQLATQAAHDPLTGLPNRRYLLDWLENAVARAARLNEPLAVLFLDLDGFSEVND